MPFCRHWPSCGCGTQSGPHTCEEPMIRLHCEFDTLEEAELWRDGMYRSYHPMGYGTHITIEKRVRTSIDINGISQTDWYWVAWGSRAESCD